MVDIFAKLGGLRASIVPIAAYFYPMFIMFFLLLLMAVIQEKLTSNYRQSLVDYVKIYND